MERRTFVKGIGAAAAAGATGIGITAFAGGAAGASAGISTNNVTITNDDGIVKQVYIDPDVDLEWSDFDEAVGAVSVFVEAKVGDDTSGPNGGYYPLHRSEPVMAYPNDNGMEMSKPGTTGSISLGPLSTIDGSNRVDLMGWDLGRNDDGTLTVSDAEHGAPDYEGATTAQDGKTSNVASDGYLQGANVSPSTIPGDAGELVNGEYGAASGTADYTPGDGQTKTTTVDVRYTFQFLQMGLEHFEAITGFSCEGLGDTGFDLDSADPVGEVRDRLDDLYDETEGEWDSSLNNTSWISDIRPSDISVIGQDENWDVSEDEDAAVWKNQKRVVMTGPGEEYTQVPGISSRHNADVRNWDGGNTPVVLTEEVSFDVTVNNEENTSGTGGNTTAGAN